MILIYIPSRGAGKSMKALGEAIERMEKLKEIEAAKIITIPPIPEELIEKMGISTGQYMEMVEILEKISPKELPSLSNILGDIAEDNRKLPAAGMEKRIRALKKELKHAKNQMERKRINQELSTVYAEKKRSERKPYRREVEDKW